MHEAYFLTFVSHYFGQINQLQCRAQWTRGLRCGFAAVRLLELRVRIPPVAWLPVSYECYVLSGSLSSRGVLPSVVRLVS
jgi:hypothetical protein